MGEKESRIRKRKRGKKKLGLRIGARWWRHSPPNCPLAVI